MLHLKSGFFESPGLGPTLAKVGSQGLHQPRAARRKLYGPSSTRVRACVIASESLDTRRGALGESCPFPDTLHELNRVEG